MTEPLDPYECFPASAYDLLGRLLEINPHDRISAEEALNHPFFTEYPDMAPAAPVVPPRKVRAEPLTTPRRRATKATEGGASTGVGAGTAAADNQQSMINGEQLHPTLNKL